MKKLILLLFVALSFNSFSQQKEPVWHTDVNKAINISVQTGKPLLFFFTGSDWCSWCIKLQKAVFTKPEFTTWANKNVVLVELDFPKRTPISDELKKQNRQLSNMFGVRGYPTVWFVTPVIKGDKIDLMEKRLGSQGASPLDVKGWIAGANKILKQK